MATAGSHTVKPKGLIAGHCLSAQDKLAVVWAPKDPAEVTALVALQSSVFSQVSSSSWPNRVYGGATGRALQWYEAYLFFSLSLYFAYLKIK